MRTAVILVLGFVGVFVVSLLAAPGSEGPPRATTLSCGPYAMSAHQRRPRYVAYGTRVDCARARRIALAYTRGHVCRRGSGCRARLAGLHCRYVGAAGRGLGWVACGQGARIHKPRVFFSVDHPGPVGAEPPDAPALPS